MIRCIIIDDEPLAHKVILNYAAKLDFLTVIASFKSPLEALSLLSQERIDLMFLDINMPAMQGLDFLRSLAHPPKVIITTAYQEYALEGYELHVLDYLLKPFPLDRFVKAVSKAIPAPAAPHVPTIAPPTVLSERLYVKSEKKTHRVYLPELLYLEGAGSYVKIHLKDETLMVLDRLSNFDEKLPATHFLRVHRSFVVGLDHIKLQEGNRLILRSGQEVPIGQMYAAQVRERLQ